MASPDVLRSLGTVELFQKDRCVFLQNDAGENMYIALKGVFGIYINSFSDFPLRVAGVENGSFFGEMSLIDGWPRSATVIAEEDGAALVIKKDNFGALLSKAPDIAVAMIETLKRRAVSSFEAARDAGCNVSGPPPDLMNARFDNPENATRVMTEFAGYIRQMDEIISVPGETPSETKKEAPEKKEIVKLLPDGYKPFNLFDLNDNNQMLQGKDLLCPYCGCAINGYIPLFSNLTPKSTALDGRVIYNNFDILWYTNIICPRCNYADTYQEFTSHSPVKINPDSDDKFNNTENFTGFDKTHKHTLDEVILSYYLNLECLRRVSAGILRHGKAWIRLYWLFGDHKRPELMRGAAENARRCYSGYLSQNAGVLVLNDLLRVNAILGELSCALSDYPRACDYFKEISSLGKLTNNEIVREGVKRYSDIKRLL